MIKPPSWQKDAVPTLVGWKHPRRNELLLPKKITQEQIDEYNGVQIDQAIHDDIQNGKIEAAMAASEPVEVDEDDVVEDWNKDGVIDELESMTKKELEDLGREHGVELDRRKNKATLVEEMREVINSK